jgi:uncharacterized protein involved in exopolysaccharide biosynthesis
VTSLGPSVGATADTAAARPSASILDELVTILTSQDIRGRLVKKHGLADKLGVSEQKAVEELGAMTRVKLNGDVGLTVTVTAKGARRQLNTRWSSPLSLDDARQMCADLANDYLTILSERQREVSQQDARMWASYIRSEADRARQRLTVAEAKMQELQVRARFMDPDTKATQLADESKTISGAYSDAGAQVASLEKSLGIGRGQLRTVDPKRISQEVTARNPIITTLEDKLAQLEVDRATQMASGKTESHPDVLQITGAIKSTQRQLQAAKAEVREQVTQGANPEYDAVVSRVVSTEVDLAAARARRAKYGALLATVKDEIAQLPGRQRSYAMLKREQEVQSQLLTSLTQRYELARMEEQSRGVGKFNQLDMAVPPLRRSGPATIVGGIIAFVGLALLLWILNASRRGILRMLGMT